MMFDDLFVLDKKMWFTPFTKLSDEEILSYSKEIRGIIPIMNRDFARFVDERIIDYLADCVFYTDLEITTENMPSIEAFRDKFTGSFCDRLKAYSKCFDKRFVAIFHKYIDMPYGVIRSDKDYSVLKDYSELARHNAYDSLKNTITKVSKRLLVSINQMIDIRRREYFDSIVGDLDLTSKGFAIRDGLYYTPEFIVKMCNFVREAARELLTLEFSLEGVTDVEENREVITPAVIFDDDEFEKLKTIHADIADGEEEFLEQVFNIAKERGIEFSLVTMGGAVSFSKTSRNDEWLKPTIDFYMDMVSKKCGPPVKSIHRNS